MDPEFLNTEGEHEHDPSVSSTSTRCPAACNLQPAARLQAAAWSLQLAGPAAGGWSLQPAAYSLQLAAYSLQPTACSLSLQFAVRRLQPLVAGADLAQWARTRLYIGGGNKQGIKTPILFSGRFSNPKWRLQNMCNS